MGLPSQGHVYSVMPAPDYADRETLADAALTSRGGRCSCLPSVLPVRVACSQPHSPEAPALPASTGSESSPAGAGSASIASSNGLSKPASMPRMSR